MKQICAIAYYILISFSATCLLFGSLGLAFWAAFASIVFARSLAPIACSAWLVVFVVVLETIRGGL